MLDFIHRERRILLLTLGGIMAVVAVFMAATTVTVLVLSGFVELETPHASSPKIIIP